MAKDLASNVGASKKEVVVLLGATSLKKIDNKGREKISNLTSCRICGNSSLGIHLDLGDLCLTGNFPLPGVEVSRFPLALAKCDQCGLAQLAHTIPVEQMYDSGYGYESHLNSQMRNHLLQSARDLEQKFEVRDGDLVLDIASNDGTLLSGFLNSEISKYGIDPLALTLNYKYPHDAIKIPSFFTAKAVQEFTDKKFKIITSFSVFYDLEVPSDFVNSIDELLSEDGVWILEQSYFFSMIETLSFDTICHEHLLYLRLKDIDNLLMQTNMEVFDLELNDINGGSFRVFVKRKSSDRNKNPFVNWIRRAETIWEKDWNTSIYSLSNRVDSFRDLFRDLLISFKQNNRLIVGLGASTKGNALLQYCNLNKDFIDFIIEINPKKIGKVTPGTHIPIYGEEVLIEQVQYKHEILGLVLPWHLYESVISHKSANVKNRRIDEFLIPLPRFPRVLHRP